VFGGAHSLCFAGYFAILRGAGATRAPKDSEFLSEKNAATREKIAGAARCRTRQFLPRGILINAMEILRLLRVELFAPLACPRHEIDDLPSTTCHRRPAIDDLKEARHALR
jgi:hypothetical protein